MIKIMMVLHKHNTLHDRLEYEPISQEGEIVIVHIH